MWTRALLLLTTVCCGGLAYPMFGSRLPNGDHVPHPCKPNFIWHGVGHINPKGGGQRNAFGKDFENNGNIWDETLCRMDSDGDGMTNGQELGDPDCVWQEGQTPPRTTGITHPGVCDPFNSVECSSYNSWVDCSSEEYNCPHIKDPDVRNITIRFPRTKVPAKETSYMCYNFRLPEDQEYHLIATEAVIDNSNVMHHMVLSGCQGKVDMLSEPQDCLMGVENCGEIIGLWTVGVGGECFNPQIGFRFGKGYMNTVSLQHHWTNPMEIDTWYDSSGLILYYTPKLRKYNAGVFTIGQAYLEIPPGMPSVTHEGTCTSECTKKIMKGDVHIVTAFNHMHYLGIRQNVTLTRPGQPPMTMTDDNPYSYDSPKLYTYDNPIIVRPGDELSTICTHQSRSRDQTTYYGAGSYEEMCFAFITYFPAENLTTPSCIQYKESDMCSDCNYGTIYNSSAPSTKAMIDKVMGACEMGSCSPECVETMEEVRDENSCIREEWETISPVYYGLDDIKLFKFAITVNSCIHLLYGTTHSNTAHPGNPYNTPAPPSEHKPSKPDDHDETKFEPGNFLIDLVKHLDARPLLQNIIMNINYNNFLSPKEKDDDDNSKDKDHDDNSEDKDHEEPSSHEHY